MIHQEVNFIALGTKTLLTQLSVPTMLVSTERGNCQLLASVYEAAEQAKGSWQTRQDFLNAPGSKGQTLLMTSCCNGYEPHTWQGHTLFAARTPILAIPRAGVAVFAAQNEALVPTAQAIPMRRLLKR